MLTHIHAQILTKSHTHSVHTHTCKHSLMLLAFTFTDTQSVLSQDDVEGPGERG